MNRRVLFGAMSQSINTFYITIPQAIMGPRLEEYYEFKKFAVGLAFATPTISYILTCTLVGYIFANFEKRSTIMSGFLLAGVSYFFIGPSELLHFGDSAVFLFIGLFMIGFALSMTMIPIVPEMIQGANIDKKYELHQAELKDRVSSIFNMTSGMGSILGPVIGGALSDSVGFQSTGDVCGFVVLGYLFLYFVFCAGPTGFMISWRNIKEGKAQKEAEEKKIQAYQNVDEQSTVDPMKEGLINNADYGTDEEEESHVLSVETKKPYEEGVPLLDPNSSHNQS